MSMISRSLGILGVVTLAVGCSACTSATPAAMVHPRRSVSRRGDAAPENAAASGAVPGSSAAPMPVVTQLGASVDLKGAAGSTVSVTVQQLVDPASGADALALPETGQRLVGVVIELANQGQSLVTDVDADTTVVGSNGQIFGHVDDPLVECTPFPLGTQSFAPGATLQGCVTFELPLDVAVRQVRFRPTAGSVPGQTGQWDVG